MENARSVVSEDLKSSRVQGRHPRDAPQQDFIHRFRGGAMNDAFQVGIVQIWGSFAQGYKRPEALSLGVS